MTLRLHRKRYLYAQIAFLPKLETLCDEKHGFAQICLDGYDNGFFKLWPKKKKKGFCPPPK